MTLCSQASPNFPVGYCPTNVLNPRYLCRLLPSSANRRFQIPKNTVSFSSVCTMKRSPSRCASAIQIVRLSRYSADPQPQLHPALLSVSDDFLIFHTGSVAFTDCSEPFAVQLCSVQAARSL